MHRTRAGSLKAGSLKKGVGQRCREAPSQTRRLQWLVLRRSVVTRLWTSAGNDEIPHNVTLSVTCVRTVLPPRHQSVHLDRLHCGDGEQRGDDGRDDRHQTGWHAPPRRTRSVSLDAAAGWGSQSGDTPVPPANARWRHGSTRRTVRWPWCRNRDRSTGAARRDAFSCRGQFDLRFPELPRRQRLPDRRMPPGRVRSCSDRLRQHLHWRELPRLTMQGWRHALA